MQACSHWLPAQSYVPISDLQLMPTGSDAYGSDPVGTFPTFHQLGTTNHIMLNSECLKYKTIIIT